LHPLGGGKRSSAKNRSPEAPELLSPKRALWPNFAVFWFRPSPGINVGPFPKFSYFAPNGHFGPIFFNPQGVPLPNRFCPYFSYFVLVLALFPYMLFTCPVAFPFALLTCVLFFLLRPCPCPFPLYVIYVPSGVPFPSYFFFFVFAAAFGGWTGWGGFVKSPLFIPITVTITFGGGRWWWGNPVMPKSLPFTQHSGMV